MSKTLSTCRKEITQIKDEITSRDRAKAMEMFGITKGTVSQYINASDSAKNLDIYCDLIKFFKSQIAKRQSILA